MMATGSLEGIAKTEGDMPELTGVTTWINSPFLKKDDLLGKVVLIDFWTYSCINCIRTLPYLKEWSEKYKNDDFVVLGIHAPEFAFEKNTDNVKKAIQDLGITYPVAIDNQFKVWNAFNNHYWPAHYLIDRQGRIRHHHFGEGEYEETENKIRELIAENGGTLHPKQTNHVAEGAQVQASQTKTISPETYIGYARTENLRIEPSIIKNHVANYKGVTGLKPDEWTLNGNWLIESEKALLKKPTGKISFQFHARDLHLVLGKNNGSKTLKFKVTIDGHPPGDEHGVDTSADGSGSIDENRLYQLIRQKEVHANENHLFEIFFYNEGVEAYAFTFG